MALASPLTGATMTGYLTSPTYTVAADLAPAPNGKQYAVTALGGTQTSVDISSVAKPFTVTMFKPALLKQLPVVNPVTGVLPAVGRNVFKVITRKGVLPLAGQSPVVLLIESSISVPVGAGDADPNSVAAALSLHIGALWEQSNEIMDTVKSGVVTF